MPPFVFANAEGSVPTLGAAIATTPAAGTSETWDLSSALAPVPQLAAGQQTPVTVGPSTDVTPEIVYLQGPVVSVDSFGAILFALTGVVAAIPNGTPFTVSCWVQSQQTASMSLGTIIANPAEGNLPSATSGSLTVTDQSWHQITYTTTATANATSDDQFYLSLGTGNVNLLVSGISVTAAGGNLVTNPNAATDATGTTSATSNSTLQVTQVTGVTPPGGQSFTTAYQIVKVWPVTVLRAEDGTAAKTHAAGDPFTPSIGAGALNTFSQGVGGVGTPATAAQSLTASAANLVTGTSVALVTGALNVGTRYRFHLGVNKTAAGVATWTAAVKFGTANTTSDAAIATWTSGTNTALIDTAILIIEVRVTALGSGTSATATCMAFYVNAQGTAITGLGSIAAAPGSTAGFNSTATSPFLHIDITPGASAVMTAWGSADQVTT